LNLSGDDALLRAGGTEDTNVRRTVHFMAMISMNRHQINHKFREEKNLLALLD